jgi:hydroxypyruvate reductase
MKSSTELRSDARGIWQAGVDAVRSEQLVANVVHRTATTLAICDQCFELSQLDRIAVVGAGKAGAGMAAALEEILGPDLVAEKVTGWVNVPADCVRPLQKIYLHPARPAGLNEPTEAGVAGALQILDLVASLGPSDLCLVLLSGGGSALLPAPVPEITLADKQAVTRFLMSAGATIGELNSVRKRLSRIKGGGLACAMRAGRMMTLIISDVVGDPLDVIASGPTVADPTTAADALKVLEKYCAAPPRVPRAVFEYLVGVSERPQPPALLPAGIQNVVIGNNALAVAAAAERARSLGYAVRSLGSENQGEANQVGRELAELCCTIRAGGVAASGPVCILSGGEPVVHLAPSAQPRKGGRNQQLVLAALTALWNEDLEGIAILSGGTDGEDGPTDAAGAFLDAEIRRQAGEQGLRPDPFLAINDAYAFFAQCGGLLQTGPTHTNVMDLRVALVDASGSNPC